MNLQRRSAITMERPGARNGSDVRLQGAWLALARTFWIAFALMALTLFVVSIPSYVAYLHVLSPVSTTQWADRISLKDLQSLQSAGLSLDFYAWYNVIFNILFLLIFVLVGVLIFWHKSDDRMALLASFTLVIFPIDNSINMLQTLPSSWTLFVQLVNFFGSASFYLFFYLFPSGRFDRRWIGWLTASMILYWVVEVFFFPSSPAPFLSILNGVLFLAFSITILVIQIYRYRRISTPIERQQTKWVVFGSIIGLGAYLVGAFVVLFLRQALHVGMLPFMLSYTVVTLCYGSVPISIAIAILRSRLWDIDVIINRALVYGTLTVSLALIYAGLIIGLQALLGGIIKQNNDVAIVVSTLIIATLFHPLRRRIQAIIDRRFYRSKYDATRTLAAFSTRLRGEVDLVQLREQLLEVVVETMQPAHVSLWLRADEQSSKPTRDREAIT
ncbi:MAG TPA: hypothetical protein VIZ18_14290 [Ktedonobacteraceae bacterium]